MQVMEACQIQLISIVPETSSMENKFILFNLRLLAHCEGFD